MSGYIKLFSEILDSTIWQEDIPTRLVWVTMMAIADKDGFVWASIPGLASRARVSLEETKIALDKFQQPDEYSRSREEEGRRIRPIDGGWALVNYQKYRMRLSPEDRKDKASMRQQIHRQNLEGPPTRDGYVYYAIAGERVKIGYSKNPWSRVYEMKCFNPDVKLAAYEPGDLAAEKNRHQQFAKYRIEREWFHLSSDIVKLIDSLRTQSSTTEPYEPLRHDKQKQEAVSSKQIADRNNSKSFNKPSIEEVSLYCASRKNLVDAEHFHSYYEANGWKVGRSVMKNWQAAVRTWEKNEQKNQFGGRDGRNSEEKRRDSNLAVRDRIRAEIIAGRSTHDLR